MASNKASGLNTVVGKGSVLEGSFEVQDGIRVDGTLRGELVSSGTLVVGPSGNLEADPIKVRDATISGRVVGKLEAKNTVRLEASAVLIGDISARSLVVEEGAVIRGFCESGETRSQEPRESSRSPHMEGNQSPSDGRTIVQEDDARTLNVKKAVG
jgi:cytoskeletal protein CcmA (bactofilin family)